MLLQLNSRCEDTCAITSAPSAPPAPWLLLAILGSLKNHATSSCPPRPLFGCGHACLCLLGKGAQAQPPLTTTQVPLFPHPPSRVGTVCLLVGTSFCLSLFFSSLYLLFSLSLLSLGLFSSSSLASSSLHLLFTLLASCPSCASHVSPGLGHQSVSPLGSWPFSTFHTNCSPGSAKSRGLLGGKIPPPTPGMGTGPLSLPFCELTPAIWGGYPVTTTAVRRGVQLCPVAESKIWTSGGIVDLT